jgi:DNA-binding IclR family transcriptional regulator
VGHRAKESERHVAAVLAALEVLDGFAETPAQRIAEISLRTGFPRSRVMRLAGTLESRGYLNYDGDLDRYRLGPRLLALGQSFEAGWDVIARARPVLHRVARETGESASLYGIEGFDRVVLARAPGTHAVRYAVTEGERKALHAGAAGKVLLAFAPPDVREAVLAGPLPRLTADTITRRKALERELDRVRRDGLAVSRGERIADVGSLAAPIFGPGATLCAALAIAAPLHRLDEVAERHHRAVLIAAGREMTLLMGGRRPDADVPVKPMRTRRDPGRQ